MAGERKGGRAELAEAVVDGVQDAGLVAARFLRSTQFLSVPHEIPGGSPGTRRQADLDGIARSRLVAACVERPPSPSVVGAPARTGRWSDGESAGVSGMAAGVGDCDLSLRPWGLGDQTIPQCHGGILA